MATIRLAGVAVRIVGVVPATHEEVGGLHRVLNAAVGAPVVVDRVRVVAGRALYVRSNAIGAGGRSIETERTAILRLEVGDVRGSSPEVGGQAVLGRQDASPTPWLTERHGYDPTWQVVHSTYDATPSGPVVEA